MWTKVFNRAKKVLWPPGANFIPIHTEKGITPWCITWRVDTCWFFFLRIKNSCEKRRESSLKRFKARSISNDPSILFSILYYDVTFVDLHVFGYYSIIAGYLSHTPPHPHFLSLTLSLPPSLSPYRRIRWICWSNTTNMCSPSWALTDWSSSRPVDNESCILSPSHSSDTENRYTSFD